MPLRRYAEFDGRSRRMEYWMFTLFCVLVYAVLLLIMAAGLPWAEITDMERPGAPSDPGVLFYIGMIGIVVFALGTIIPNIAVTIRRFHDQDLSGWFYLLNFIPYIGGLIVLVFMFIDGTRGPNRFGDSPKYDNAAAVFE